MTDVPAGPAHPADDLRAAFGRYASTTGWRWKASIRPLIPEDPHMAADAAPVVRIDLCAADASALTGLLLVAADPDEGPGPRGPIGSWMGTADVARRLSVAPSTIRGWISRGEPRGNPFPKPGTSYGNRSYWQKRTIDRWKAREERRNDKKRRTSRSRPQ